MTAIGIDLGTTNSVAAIAGREKRVLKKPGSETSLTPSVVALDVRSKKIIVGRDAVANAGRDPANTIFSIKRLMGRLYHEKWEIYDGQVDVEVVGQHVNYDIAPPPPADSPGADDHGVKVLLGGTPQSPVDVSAHILRKVKADAEEALGRAVTHAVITMPAYFTGRQREATIEAGQRAGLEVLAVLDEPSAAALAFGAGREEENHTVLVYDLGGGTFDISIVQMRGGKYVQVQTEGDCWMGGDDFDRKIVDRLSQCVLDEYGIDPSQNKVFLARAKEAAEAAKITLSSAESVEIFLTVLKLPPLERAVDVKLKLTRQQFEEDIRPLVDGTMKRVEAALRKASREPRQISEVLLVGGSTRVPLVRAAVTAMFGPDKVKDHVDPMECVALGAAIHAATFPLGDAPAPKESRPPSRIIQRTPRALGIAARVGDDNEAFVKIIPENTIYPLAAPLWKEFYPQKENQRLIKVAVFEGNHSMVSLNEQQGVVEFQLPEGISSGTPVDVGLNYDENRTLTVEVRIKGHEGGPYRATICRDRPVVTLKDDPREKLAPWIQAGRHFGDLYRDYMERADFEELCQALKVGDEALRTGSHDLGERALRVLQNRVLGSGVASQLFLAERAQNAPCATAEDRQTLGRAVARLKLAAANSRNPKLTEAQRAAAAAEAEAIVKELRPRVSEVFSREDRGPRVGDKADADGGLLHRAVAAGTGSTGEGQS